MEFNLEDLGNKISSIDLQKTVEYAKEQSGYLQEKVSDFHENFVSKVVPQEGIYGDAANFALELIPGVSEYNDIRNGDWGKLPIDIALDVATLIPPATAAAVGAKLGIKSAEKAAVKVAEKAVVEASEKAVVKVTEKVVAEAGEKAVVEVTEKVAAETAEKGVKNVVEETVEVTEPVVKKATTESAEEAAEAGVKKGVEEGAEKAKNISPEKIEKGDPIKNKMEGMRRELKCQEKLEKKYPEKDGYKIKKEKYLYDCAGQLAKDPQTGEGRRIDFVVIKDEKVIDSIEVTSLFADKGSQLAKEQRIRKDGGNYINSERKLSEKKLIEMPKSVTTRVERIE